MQVRKAVIPAAGLGTRFLPITKAIPKPMLPVLDKPTIQYIVEELYDIGIEEILIVIAPNSKVIEKHFTKDEKLENRLLQDGKESLFEIAKNTSKIKVKFTIQKSANGLAGAVLSAKDFIKEEPFALLLGDEFMCVENGEKSCIAQLKEIFELTDKSVISTMQVFGDDVSKYGNIGIESEENGVLSVSEVIEKPSLNDALSNYAIIGRYVFSNEIMELVEQLKMQGNELNFTEAINELAKRGKLLATEFEGKRYDVGDKLGYIKANVDVALMSKEIGEGTKQYILELAEKLK